MVSIGLSSSQTENQVRFVLNCATVTWSLESHTHRLLRSEGKTDMKSKLGVRRSMGQAWRDTAPEFWQGKNRSGERGHPATGLVTPLLSNLCEISHHRETQILPGENLTNL